jgi:hypothetical protein
VKVTYYIIASYETDCRKRSKTDKYDVLRFVRNNGSCTDALMPRQGILPHDLVHYVVESALPLRHGFLSLLARGADAQFVMESVHDKANPHVEPRPCRRKPSWKACRRSSGPAPSTKRLSWPAPPPAPPAKPPFDFSRWRWMKTLYDRASPCTSNGTRALLQHPVAGIQPAAG